MDPQRQSLQERADSRPVDTDIPKRSSFWFGNGLHVNLSGALFDRITVVFSICLALSSFVIFWPIVVRINFEEAFFTPLAPFLMSALSLLGLAENDAIRVLFIASFMISTVGVYLLVRDLTKRQVPAILAAVAYLVPPIPIFILTYVRTGLLATELGSAKSFFTIVYGDGAHFLALALIPFTTLFFLRYLKTGNKVHFATTIIFASLILLANRTQSLNLAIVLTITLVTEAFLGKARVKLSRALLVAILSIGLVSFWYTPSFWFESIATFVKVGAVNLKYLFPLPALLSVFSLFFSFVYFARREDRQPIFIAFLAFVVFLGIGVEWLATGRDFVPHPHRILSNLNMFGAVVAALALSWVVDELAIVSRFKLISWSTSARTLAALGFGSVSLLVLTIATYTLSPLAILALSGPKGVWTKIRLNVLFDRQETLALAGGNFRLVNISESLWEAIFGLALSVIFLIILVTIILRDRLGEEG